MAEIRCWTVRQPYACAIVSPHKTAGFKDRENRTRFLGYRGLVAIHAGLAFAEEQDTPQWALATEAFAAAPAELTQTGAILGFARLADCHAAAPGCCGSVWGEPDVGVWHNALADNRAFAEPIEGVRGALGLWRPAGPLLADIERAMESALSLPGGVR
jgi:hypothetical protein